MELHNYFLQKISNGSHFPIDSSCQTFLVQANFSLVAWNGSMLFFWGRSGKETRSKVAFPFGRLAFLLLFWGALLYSPSLLGQNYSKSKFLFSLLFGQKNSPSNFCLSRKSFQFYKIILSPTFFLSQKNFLFPPTDYILLPMESEECQLTLASVLACADSADELQFWGMSGS